MTATNIPSGSKKEGLPEAHERLIGGAWKESSDAATFESINPFTSNAWAQVPTATEADVDEAVQPARRTFEDGP